MDGCAEIPSALQSPVIRIGSRKVVGWVIGVAAVVLAVSFAVTSWALSRLEHRAYDGLVTTVEVGCEADEVRQVGVEVYLWHTDSYVCVPTLSRAEVEPVGDAIFVTLFERCRRSDDPPVLGPLGMLPRHVFTVPVRWKRPGPTLYVNEYAEGRLTKPRPIRVHPSCAAGGVGATGVAR
jgi:hypothetical protein